jgi:MOSC domain-containing protein
MPQNTSVPTQPRVISLQRFPVKSMLGQAVAELYLEARGCVGDRRWSVRTADGKIGSGKSSRRFAAVPGLLELRAEESDGPVVVVFPDGSSCSVDGTEVADRVSRYVGQRVTMARETDVSHFDDGPVSLIGRASVEAVAAAQGQAVDASRFRANVVLDTALPFEEEEWVGRRLQLGSSVLEVTMASPRCVMVDAKTADLEAQPGNLKTLGRLNSARLGVVATVVVPGRVGVGDVLQVC